MDTNIVYLNKIIFMTVGSLFVYLINVLLKKSAKNIAHKRGIRTARYLTIKRFISIMSLLLWVLLIVIIWGVNIKELWVSIAGILAMVAVAFFAVWSLVGNILAGLIIYFTCPFKVNDTIEILPDNIKGEVLAINTFYSIIADEDDNYINVPNSLFFQKYIKRIRKKG